MNEKLTVIGKTIKILRAMSEEPYIYSVAELSKKLNINRTTVNRIIKQLSNELFVVQNKSNKKYTIGPSLFHIGSKYLYKNDKFSAIREVVDNIALNTMQNIGYSILEKGIVMNLYESEIAMPVKITYQHGTIFPINCGAYGKTIMAFYEPLEELEKIVTTSKLEKKTPKTITNPNELLKEYEKIRQQGYAFSDEEHLQGAFGLGVPIFNPEGKIHGCIGLAAINSLSNRKEINIYIEELKKGAYEIEKYII